MGFLGSEFTYNELKDVVNANRDSSRARAFQGAIRRTITAAQTYPDLSSENIRGLLLSVQDRGDSVIQGGFTRYESSRRAVTHWKEKEHSNLREKIGLPEDTTVSPQFLEDCVAVRMPDLSLNAYWRHKVEQIGVSVPEGNEINGIYLHDVYLEDEEGNRCNVFLSKDTESEESRRAFLHESGHEIFGNYYDREKKVDRSPINDLRAYYSQFYISHMQDHEVLEASGIQKVLSRGLQIVLNSHSKLFYNEKFADGYSGKLEGARNAYEAKDFDPTAVYAFKQVYTYTETLSKRLDGIIDALHTTSLSPEDKLRIQWNLEKQTTVSVFQNYIIDTWIASLWRKSHGDRIEFISSMMAVPISRIWNIGHHLDTDPEIMKQQLMEEPQDLNQRVASRMMIRNIHDKGYPDMIKTYVSEFPGYIEDHLPAITDSLSDETKTKVVVDDFMSNLFAPRFEGLADRIFEEQVAFFENLRRAEIADIDHGVILNFVVKNLDEAFDFSEYNNIFSSVLKNANIDESAANALLKRWKTFSVKYWDEVIIENLIKHFNAKGLTLG